MTNLTNISTGRQGEAADPTISRHRESPGQNRAEEFVDRPQPLAPALAALMRSDWDRVQKRVRCMAAIRHADIDDDRRFLLAKLVEIYVELNEAETERYRAELTKQDNEEVREMVITWEETLAAAEDRGVLIATRNSVMRVLSRRFGSVPTFVRQKLDAIRSVERLEEIHDHALTVSSVDELVFEDEPSN